MSRLLSDADFERDALDYFPTPLADTLDEASAEMALRAQRDRVVEVFRVAIRLLALMALGEPRGLVSAQAHPRQLLKKLTRRGLTDGEWIGLMREFVRPFAANPERSAVPELVTSVFTAGGKLRPVFQQQGATESLLTMRKSETVAHGVTGSEEDAEDVLAARLPDLEVFLKALQWLWHTPFIVPVSRRELDSTVEYAALKLVGTTPRRGFRPQAIKIEADLTLQRVYALVPDRKPLDLHPLVQYAAAASGDHEVFLLEEAARHELIFRSYPLGATRPDPEALTWFRAKYSDEAKPTRTPVAHTEREWTLEHLQEVAQKVSVDYLDKMRAERIFLPHLYAGRRDLETHLDGFLDAECTKSGLLIIGSSGIGKTNTLCHIVDQWRRELTAARKAILLFLGGTTLPGGSLVLRDLILDRLELAGTFGSFMTTFDRLPASERPQLVVIVDGVDKHPQSTELLRQLDDLVVRSEDFPWFKVVIAIAEVAYRNMRAAGFIPAARDYYTTEKADGHVQRESAEIHLGPMTDEELVDAYEKYRREPGLAPVTPFDELTDDVRNALRNPLFLRIAMEVFDSRRVPRRLLTAEVLLEYCNQKIFADKSRTYFCNRLVDLLFDNRWRELRLDALLDVAELRESVLNSSSDSAYVQLLDEQVIQEVQKRASAILPPERTIAFTYDRLLEYLLLKRMVERYGTSPAALVEVGKQAESYLPLRGALAMLLLARVDEGRIDDVVSVLTAGENEVIASIGVSLLMELEQLQPTSASVTRDQLQNSPVGLLVASMLRAPSRWVVDLLLEFGSALRDAGYFSRARFVYEELSGSMGGADPLESARLQEGIGEVHEVLGEKSEALTAYKKALEFYIQGGSSAGEQAVYDALGEVHQQLGDYREAREYFEKSLLLDQELVAATGSDSAHLGKAETLLNLSENYHATGDLEESIGWAEQALAVYREVQDKRGTARALDQIGVLTRRQGAFEKARNHHEQALTIHRQVGDRLGVAEDLCHLGLAYHIEGRWTEALSSYDQARAISENVGNKDLIASTFNAMGETLRWAGRLAEADSAYRRALAIYEATGSRGGIAMCLNNLGATELFSGNGAKAVGLLGRAATYERATFDSCSADSECLAYLSAAALQVGDLEAALSHSDRAVEVVRRKTFGEEDIQLVYFYRYQILDQLGQGDDARESLRIAHDNVVDQARSIDDSGRRRSFLTGFPLRKWIVEAWESR